MLFRSQVRDAEFERLIHERLTLAEQDKKAAVALAQAQVAGESQKAVAAKEAQIQELKAKLDAGQKASDEIRTSVSSLRAKGQNTAALEAEGRDLQASNARLQGALDRMNAALGKIEA